MWLSLKIKTNKLELEFYEKNKFDRLSWSSYFLNFNLIEIEDVWSIVNNKL